MDTRNKILTEEDALSRSWSRPVVVTGAFDVIRADLVRELARIRERAGTATLVAVVLPAEGAALPQRARAELVAAMRVIDYVLILETLDVEPFLARLAPCETVRLETADACRARQLSEHVRTRYSS